MTPRPSRIEGAQNGLSRLTATADDEAAAFGDEYLDADLPPVAHLRSFSDGFYSFDKSSLSSECSDVSLERQKGFPCSRTSHLSAESGVGEEISSSEVPSKPETVTSYANTPDNELPDNNRVLCSAADNSRVRGEMSDNSKVHDETPDKGRVCREDTDNSEVKTAVCDVTTITDDDVKVELDSCNVMDKNIVIQVKKQCSNADSKQEINGTVDKPDSRISLPIMRKLSLSPQNSSSMFYNPYKTEPIQLNIPTVDNSSNSFLTVNHMENQTDCDSDCSDIQVIRIITRL